MAFTFKKEPAATGLMAVGNSKQSVAIKLKKKEVGMIYAPNWQSKTDKYRIALRVVDPTGENKKWKWIFLKAQPETEEAAREWLNANFDTIVSKFTLSPEED